MKLEQTILCLAGPTASGKTAAAVELAHKIKQTYALSVEVISVDSALVYRQMDIGTAKPTSEEMAGIKHHLIDIIEPSERYNVADFVTDTNALISQIRARGACPLLVGGTMLYFNSWLNGIDTMPTVSEAIKAQVQQQGQQLGWPALHAKLSQVDAVTAARLSINDQQRIGRALAVYYASGKPLSAFQLGMGDKNGQPAHLLFSLEPQQRAWLHQRVEQRFELMLQQGFIDEMQRLRQRGDLDAQLPSMRCVGYRQAWQFCEGEITQQQFVEQAQAATRQLVKRQLTWLRKMPQRQVIACDQPDAVEQLWQQIQQYQFWR